MLPLVLVVLVTTAYAGQDKVEVCHITGTHDFSAYSTDEQVGDVSIFATFNL